MLDYLCAAATCATHLSQLGAEIVLWSSEEFGFCEVADAFASGSSIMPQKKNPDAAELLRAKAPRIAVRLVALHGALHGLPLTYNKDLQEDKEPLFDAVDTLELCLRVADGMLGGDLLRPRAAGRAASDEMLAATDVADLLVKPGVPFREAHGIVGGWCARRSTAASSCPSSPRRSWRSWRRSCDPARSRGALATARGSSRRARRAARRSTGCASSWRRRAHALVE